MKRVLGLLAVSCALGLPLGLMQLPAAAAPKIKKRAVPDYDGRGKPRTTPGDVALWVPRILASPLYVLSEYGLRQPLGALVTYSEENSIPAKVEHILRFGRDDTKLILIPTAFVEFGLKPSVGLDFRARDLGVPGNSLSINGALWPTNWWALTVVDRYENQQKKQAWILLGRITIRPDRAFYGIGPDSQNDDRGFYSRQDYELGAAFEHVPWRRSMIRVAQKLHRAIFDSDSSFGRSVQDLKDAGIITHLPPGMTSGYSAWKQSVEAVLDSRKKRQHDTDGGGIQIKGKGEYAVDLANPGGIQWIKYGGGVTGFVDVTGKHRVVSVGLEMNFADPIKGEVPFTELATLGGAEPFIGFREGRLYGRSSAAATVAYTWPVWSWLDMSANLSIGNVFGPHLSGFSLKKQRLAGAIGFRTHGPLGSVSLLLGAGTDTIERGMGLDGLRFFVRGQSEF